ncbi:helix-turn-helix transcriptional regulator [Acidovorax sp.]|uniref:helix-turn-helix domain-containing protein n=1 Tax=Acidovorax sp. TaxID=1872122 RepID=UPI0031D71605
MLAYQIRWLRVEKGWSQERLANECGLDRTYVSAVERSTWNIALGNIERLALALGVEAWTLLQPPQGAKPASKVCAPKTPSLETPPKARTKARTKASGEATTARPRSTRSPKSSL